MRSGLLPQVLLVGTGIFMGVLGTLSAINLGFIR